ncbi:MAG: cysteine hydrolase [Eubacteriales bacterium]|nr:cysteine hydrolase [Eubacteriales bacterium]
MSQSTIRKLLLVIDYQNDFVTDDGYLTAGKPAQAIESAILTRIAAYQAAEADILCTLDTHTPADWQTGHPESVAFNLHCAESTPGWGLFGGLAKLDLETLTKGSYMLEAADIDWLARQYDAIELAGVVTDICVLQNAIGLYNHAANHGLKIKFSICPACVASFNETNHEWALKYMLGTLGFNAVEKPDAKV